MAFNPASRLAHSTVRIECDLDGGVGTGTGFFYSLDRRDDQHVPVIVTNWHVVEGAKNGRFVLTVQDESGGPAIGTKHAYEMNRFEERWTRHPDPNVDLAVMPIGPLLNQAEQSNTKFYFTSLDQTAIPSEDDLEQMFGVEAVTMVGYPNGLWDERNNLPIFRKGVLATDLRQDWNGKKEFLIDAACFPGSSGSPVVLLDLGSYATTNGALVAGSRLKLLGILYAGPQYTVEGEVKIVPVPRTQRVVAVSAIPNNLGIVIKAEMLNVFEGRFR